MIYISGNKYRMLNSYYKRKEDILYDLISEKFNFVKFIEFVLKDVDSIINTNIIEILIDKIFSCEEFRSIYAIF